MKPSHDGHAGIPPEYTALYDFAPALYVLLDEAGMIVEINTTGARLLSRSRRQMRGMPFRMMIAEEHRLEFLSHMRRCRSSNAVAECEVRLIASDHGRILVRLFSRKTTFRGRRLFPTVALDLTEYELLERARISAEQQRDRAEQLREVASAAAAARDRLIAVVSHELRNPLSPVLVAADNLVSWPGLPERARQLATVIKRNVELEARLIDDLLDLARVTRGRLELDLKPADLHEVLLDAVNACAPSAESRGAAIVIDLQATRHHCLVDATRLRQVFWNLISNAVKFSEPGGTISVRTTSDDQLMRVTVRDRGLGMDRSVLSQLFSPFTETQESSNRRGGLGLGLSISRGIVEAHGGRIWATSDGPGRGSTFEVELSTCDAPESLPVRDREAPAETQSSPAVSPATAASRRRVLVVEDHADTGTLMAMFLSQHGYDVTLAQTLTEGLRALDRQWDVVLSDIGLVDGSGLEIAEHARRLPHRPGRMIALSGYGTGSDVAASRAAGFDDHLVKPVDFKKLLAALLPLSADEAIPVRSSQP